MADIDFTEWIKNIQNECGIVRVAESLGVKVQKKSYNKSFACCPLHNEKTPSFCLFEDTNRFYCFGCNESGGVLDLIQKTNNLSFWESIDFLKDKFNITVPNFSKSDKFQNRLSNDRLYKLMEFVKNFYKRELYTKDGEMALEYFKSRGLSLDVINRFEMGFASSDRKLMSELLSAGFKKNEIIQAGVGYEGRYGLTDHLYQRAIVPIFNRIGKVVAFGGRVLVKSDLKAKYKNTAETPIFEKRKELFNLNGLSECRKETKCIDGKLPYIILVEGYMDAISLYQYGFKNAVASMGTALTVDQIKLLAMYTNKVLLNYDADQAGINAMLRAGDLFKNTDISLGIIELKGAKDPDEFLSKYDKEKYQECINEAVSIVDYKIKKAAEAFDFSSSDDLMKYILEVKKIIKDTAKYYMPNLYYSLISNITKISATKLEKYFEENDNDLFKKLSDDKQIEDSRNDILIKYFLYSLYSGDDFIGEFKNIIKIIEHKIDLKTDEYKKLYYATLTNGNEKPLLLDLDALYSNASESLYNEIINSDANIHTKDERYKHLKQENERLATVILEEQIKMLNDELKKEEVKEEKNRIIAQLNLLYKEKAKLKLNLKNGGH